MTIGEKIYELRKQKGLSQEELAEKLNVSRQSVSLWETNQTVPQIDYLMELSKIFNKYVSFQYHTKLNKKVVKIAPAAKGILILKKIFNSPAPSISAASYNLFSPHPH